jgi:methyltransferase
MADSRVIGLGAAVFALMLAETGLSVRNARRLRALGAMEALGDVLPLMTVAYPLSFLVMLVESLASGAPGRIWWAVGLVVWLAAKALKYAAIWQLGERWSFRVLVVPGRPLEAGGPYRWMAHPNYLGVMGELVGTAVAVRAPVSGLVAVIVFGVLLRRRIRIEERALGRSSAGVV